MALQTRGPKMLDKWSFYIFFTFQFNKIHCVLQVNKSAVNAVSIDDDGQGPCLAAAGDDGIVKVYRWFPPSV